MALIKRLLICLSALALVACESGGLGMNVDVEEVDVPAKIADTVAEKKTGTLTIAVTEEGAKSYLAPLAKAFGTEDTPDGVLTFTALSIRNRSMQHPPRASGEIDATCIWKETDGKAECYTVRIRTFSIEIDDWKTQPQWLKDEAMKRMVKELENEM